MPPKHTKRSGTKRKVADEIEDSSLNLVKKTKSEELESSTTTSKGSGDVAATTASYKITSWNVAGFKACIKKDGHKWIAEDQADIVCLNEVKCSEKFLPENLTDLYQNIFWNEASCKKGYSGVALLSKSKPVQTTYGIGNDEYDQEGRVITAEYANFYVVAAYVPNSGRKLVRLDYRMNWNKEFKNYLQTLDSKKPVILVGDLNVSHEEIDLANPKPNKRNAGFTQEERDGMSDLLKSGFSDVFRRLHPDTVKYTFWTYMSNARARNVGWRLDYFIVSDRILKNALTCSMQSSVLGSDHCPITLAIDLHPTKENSKID